MSILKRLPGKLFGGGGAKGLEVILLLTEDGALLIFLSSDEDFLRKFIFRRPFGKLVGGGGGCVGVRIFGILALIALVTGGLLLAFCCEDDLFSKVLVGGGGGGGGTFVIFVFDSIAPNEVLVLLSTCFESGFFGGEISIF